MFNHYLLTRFNVDLYTNNKYSIKDKGAWMRRRIREFEEWTAPSINIQTELNFDWIILLDQNTPDGYIKQIQGVLEDTAKNVNCTILYMEELDSYLNTEEHKFIITSRVDNDDILHSDYIKEIQESFESKVQVIDVDGEQWDTQTNKYYTSGRDGKNSPFLSLVEKTDMDIKTCFEHDHTYMPWYYESKKIDKVLYTQVLHNNNIANKIKGIEKRHNSNS